MSSIFSEYIRFQRVTRTLTPAHTHTHTRTLEDKCQRLIIILVIHHSERNYGSS